MRSKADFIAAVINSHTKGTINVFLVLATAGYVQETDESDDEFMRRSLEQDYEDAEVQGCIFSAFLTAPATQ